MMDTDTLSYHSIFNNKLKKRREGHIWWPLHFRILGGRLYSVFSSICICRELLLRRDPFVFGLGSMGLLKRFQKGERRVEKVPPVCLLGLNPLNAVACLVRNWLMC